MSKTSLALVVSLALLSTMAVAEAGGSPALMDNSGQQQHHSRLGKAAFWRHLHKGKDSKKAESKPAPSKPVAVARAKTKSSKPAVSKKSHSTKQQVSSAHKPAVKKAPARKVVTSKHATSNRVAGAHIAGKHHVTAKKAKPQSKTAHHTTTASLQQ